MFSVKRGRSDRLEVFPGIGMPKVAWELEGFKKEIFTGVPVTAHVRIN